MTQILPIITSQKQHSDNARRPQVVERVPDLLPIGHKTGKAQNSQEDLTSFLPIRGQILAMEAQDRNVRY